MPSAFEKLSKSYKDVPFVKEQEIQVAAFLEATEGLVQILGNMIKSLILIESLGAAFGPVKSDILGNVTVLSSKISLISIENTHIHIFQSIMRVITIDCIT